MNTTDIVAAITPSTTNPNKQQKQTAKDVIAANVQALIEQLEQGHSEALTAYLTAMGRFHDYSFDKILEIARQKAVTYCYTSLESINIGGCALLETRDGRVVAVPIKSTGLVDREQSTLDRIRPQHQVDVVVLSIHTAITDLAE
jgi:hypothetical protein